MSVTDPSPDPVQPEGQGGQGNEAPYAEYLSRIPEQVRGDVEPVFREWDGNVTRMRQADAEYRQQWAPYEQSGVNSLAPETVQELVKFHEAVNSNPEAIVEWARGYAQENGLTLAEAAQAAADVTPDEFGFDTQSLEKLLDSRLSPVTQQLQKFAEWQQGQEQQAALSKAQAHIDTQLRELEGKHPGEFDREAIDPFLGRYVESDPRNAVPRAWADYQAWKAKIEKGFIAPKLGQRPGGEGGGPADGNPPAIKTLAEAKAAAAEYLNRR